MTVERVQRWNGGFIYAGGLVLSGLVLGNPVLLVAAAIPVLFVIFGEVSRLPASPPLAIERTVSPSSPVPGEHVTVELAVENIGETTLSDVRIVDGVPSDLQVTNGTPRASVALRPGAETTIEYELVARRGEHDFNEPVVRIRTLSATRRRTDRIKTNGTTTISCLATIDETPLQDVTTRQVGELATDTPGSGLEFYATREYRTDDPLNRIDWRRYARVGELTTIQYREQHAARILLVVDARQTARVTPHPGHPDGIELSAYGARRAFGSLTDAGHHVGLVGLGVREEAIDAVVPMAGQRLPLVAAGADSETTTRIEAVLEAARETDDGHLTPSGSQVGKSISRHLTSTTQVILLSPVTDDDIVSLVRQLRTEGYEITVISPDLTSSTAPGESVSAIERAIRLTDLRETGVMVIDWDPSDPLWTALSTALNRLL